MTLVPVAAGASTNAAAARNAEFDPRFPTHRGGRPRCRGRVERQGQSEPVAAAVAAPAERAFVANIAGTDRRGTSYGLYTFASLPHLYEAGHRGQAVLGFALCNQSMSLS